MDYADYNEINEAIGESKSLKILGYFFLVAGILIFIVTIVTNISWKLKENNYVKEYVYSDTGVLYYENNGEKVFVKKIYDTNDEAIELNVPDGMTTIMYCIKNNPNECVYFDQNSNPPDTLHFIIAMFATLFLLAVGLHLTCKKRYNLIPEESSSASEYEQSSSLESGHYKKGTSLDSVYLGYVFFFIIGIGCISWQVYNAINYYNIKKESSIATATIFSEIYHIGSFLLLRWKSKYIYVNDSYEKGNLQDNLGNTFELYYSKNNPSKVSKKEKPINFGLLLAGILFTTVTFPFVFFKEKMERRIDKTYAKVKRKEWNI